MLTDAHETDQAGEQCRGTLLAILERVAACCAPPAERRDAAEHRQHILAVARRLFAERGVDDVSMHQVARAAGLGQATLYRRFAHKGELCMALLVESVIRLQAEMCSYFQSCTPSTPAREQLAYVLSRHVTFNEENAGLLSAVVEAACGNRRSGLYHNPIYMAMRQTVETLLRHAVERGEMPPMDSAYVAEAMLAALEIDLYIHQRTEQGFTPERILRGLERIFIDGLCSGTAGADRHGAQ